MPNPVLNFFDTYTLIAISREIAPVPSFFRDRYFPTAPEDIFDSDKVLTEYQKGDHRMAPFVTPRIGDIPVDRTGYEIYEYQPAFIAPSRLLTIDDLRKRGFGEAMYPGSTPAERAARLQLKDMTDLDKKITRREEWMAVQTMIHNACEMQEYVDSQTKGACNFIAFYDKDANEHKYTVSKKWDSAEGNIIGDVKAMCRLLQQRGLPAADLVLGSSAAEAVLSKSELRELLNKNLAYDFGSIENDIVYPGVVRMGTLNFGGFRLTLWDVSETYEDDSGNTTLYFPANSAMVTAPACGHMMYGRITQIDYGSENHTDYAAKRVPKFSVDQEKDIRKMRLAARPLAAPKDYCPWIYAAEVCE